MKVTVLITTYNHAKYIACAINSVLMQQCPFNYEIVVIDDCSTDGTTEILVEYQKRFPDKIRLLLNEKNECNNTQWINAMQSSTAEYIAYLDGDDCWISADKLVKQVCFLDDQLECAICFHNVVVFAENGLETPYLHNDPAIQKKYSNLSDLLHANFIAGCAPMVRRALLTEFPEWFHTAIWGDWPLYILYAQQGSIGFIDEVMGAYRLHPEGFWNRLGKKQQITEVISFLKQINLVLNFDYDRQIKFRVSCLEDFRFVISLLEAPVSLYKRFFKRDNSRKPTEYIQGCSLNDRLLGMYLPAALMIGAGGDASKLLNEVFPQGHRTIDSTELASIIFRLAPAVTRKTSTAWTQLQSSCEPQIAKFLSTLERQCGTPGLAGDTQEILRGMIGEQLSTHSPVVEVSLYRQPGWTVAPNLRNEGANTLTRYSTLLKWLALNVEQQLTRLFVAAKSNFYNKVQQTISRP
jgi:glycosyltransferase involved in cell wall biosynthesis